MIHLFSKERLPFTLVYLSTLVGKCGKPGQIHKI